MTVKQHYDSHLGFFYSWMLGDFESHKNKFIEFCTSQQILPQYTGAALDLGAGNGIQSVALAKIGFSVTAIDFNEHLLTEIAGYKKTLPIEIINDDLQNVLYYKDKNPELIVCCGDTISHLDSESDISQTLSHIYQTLIPSGKIILSFRDYSQELSDTNRFIPVKSDPQRILTCFIEYFERKVRVTDLLYEKESGVWIFKKSSYFKVRVTGEMISDLLTINGFNIIYNDIINGMVTLVGQKVD